VTDSIKATAIQSLSIIINNPPPSIDTSSLPNGIVNVAYSYTLSVVSGTPPYTWAIVNGGLPAGLSISSSGVILGTPTTAGGPTIVTFQVTDSIKETAMQSLAITINSKSPITTKRSLPIGIIVFSTILTEIVVLVFLHNLLKKDGHFY